MRNERTVKKPSGKDKKKNENKEKPKISSSPIEEDTSLIDNLKTNYWKVFVCAGIFFMLVYFQILHSKSSRYETNKDSDIDYWDILGVENNSNLPTINKKYRELAKIW